MANEVTGESPELYFVESPLSTKSKLLRQPLDLALARQPQDTRDSLRVHDLAAHHHTHRALERDEVHLDVLVFFGSRFALRELLREEQVHALVEKSRRRPEAERMRPLLRRDAGLFR